MPAEKEYISVSQLNKSINQSLEKALPIVYFEGEISQCIRAASGHYYLTLKDENCEISSVMWKGVAQSLSFVPETGISVLCDGKPSVYPVKGRLQVVLHRMSPVGEGDLQKKFLELKEKLNKEGLFSKDRKRELPFLPREIGIVTSETGAVIHDIMVKLRERFPSVRVSLVDARVQGEGAAEEIVSGIRLLNQIDTIDVIIVARGGGSLEDLWAFNEEKVVRAIFASKKPIISGVGHEVDITLSDLVADVRAPTPTAAAEMVIPKKSDLLDLILDYERRLSDLDYWFYPLAENLDDLSIRFNKRIKTSLDEYIEKFEGAKKSLRLLKPDQIINNFAQGLDSLQKRLRINYKSLLQSKYLMLDKVKSRLNILNPEHVLKLGYSIVEYQGLIIKNVKDIKLKDEINIRLARGSIDAEVVKKH